MKTEETTTAPLRLSLSERKELQKEANDQYRTLASYLRMLVVTHPDRKKKK